MTKVGTYRDVLRGLAEWDGYLLQNSGLPGPRANLELAQAVAQVGDETLFRRYLTLDAERAPTNTPLAFLAVCGVLGLGRLLSEGDTSLLVDLRRLASDPRWRIREAVAMALQAYGDADMDRLLGAMQNWGLGSPLEKRAAAAALAEPRLLRNPGHAQQVLDILDSMTAWVEACGERSGEQFKVLRQGLGYCWSVVVAALPEPGKVRMECWFQSEDPDVRWIMRENLNKRRLGRLDEDWVRRGRATLQVRASAASLLLNGS